MTEELKKQFASVNAKLDAMLEVLNATNKVMANTNNTNNNNK